MIRRTIKPEILAGILLFLFSAVAAQTNLDWFPVRPGVNYNYRTDTSSVAISNVVKIDSASGQTYYLNRIVITCDTCHNALLANDPFDSTYVLANQQQFLGRVFLKAGNAFYFRGSSSFVLYPYASAGSSWLYDTVHNITATLLYRSQQPVFGSSDSVSTIRLSTADTIVLSKHHGILQFPIATAAHHRYRLAGIEGPVNAGERLRRFHDFFDLHAGDVFQYTFSDNDYNLFPPRFLAGRERLDILSATIYADSVCFTARKTHLDSVKFGNGTAVINAFTATVHLAFTDSAAHPANALPLQVVEANPYFIFNNGQRHIHKLVIGAEGQRVTKTIGQVCPYQYLSPA